MGVTPDDEGVNVALWTEDADKVEFCLFEEDGSETRYELDEQTFHI